jgi:hypothetical protein
MTEAVQPRAIELARSAAQPADCTPDQLAETRYVKALEELVADAWEAKRLHILADALAWTVARVAVGCGVAATGDVLRRIGGYIGKIETERQAAEEAKQARQEGRLPH